MYSVLLPNMNIYTENGYLLMSLEKVVRKNGFSFLIMKNPCADFLQAGTGTNLHKYFLRNLLSNSNPIIKSLLY